MYDFKPAINKKSEKIVKEKSMLYEFIGSPKLENDVESNSKTMISSQSLNKSGIISGNKFHNLYEDAR